MRGQVPHDVDVGLQQAQVGAGGVDVVDLAEFSIADQVTHDIDGRVILEGMTDHCSQVQTVGRLGDVHRLGHGRRQRFLDHHVLACAQSGHSEWVMSGYGSGYDNCIHTRRQQLPVVPRCLGPGVEACHVI